MNEEMRCNTPKKSSNKSKTHESVKLYGGQRLIQVRCGYCVWQLRLKIKNLATQSSFLFEKIKA